MRNASAPKSKTIFRLRREELEITLKKAAAMTNISESRLNEIENGKVTATIEEIRSISEAYNQPHLVDRYYLTEHTVEKKGKTLLNKESIKLWCEILTVFATVISTILVLSTLHEMKVQRNNTYMPNLLFETVTFAFSWGDLETLKDEISYKKIEEKPMNPDDIKIPVRNIGVGVAKNLSFTMRIENYASWLSSFNEQYPEIQYTYDQQTDFLIVPRTNQRSHYASSFYAGSQENKAFLLPNAEEVYEFVLPSYCISLLREFALARYSDDKANIDTDNEVAEIPDLKIQLLISFEDIQGVKYNKTIVLKVQPVLSVYDMLQDSGLTAYSIIMN